MCIAIDPVLEKTTALSGQGQLSLAFRQDCFMVVDVLVACGANTVVRSCLECWALRSAHYSALLSRVLVCDD